MASLKSRSISGVLWTLLDRFSLQLINFVVGIILARILMPEDFGLIGMIMIVLTLGQTLRDSGFASSLLRSKDNTTDDYTTIFYTGILLSAFIYLVIYFAAPYVALFYEKDILINVIRLFALKIVIDSFSSVQNIILIKSLNFKRQFIIQLPSVIIAGFLGVSLAYNDFGVYSIVIMHVFQSLLISIQLWAYSDWRPVIRFKKEVLEKHFSYGYKLTLTSILETLYNNIYNILIGKFFAANILGFYTRANSLQQLPSNNVSFALSKVSFPVFAEIQDDIPRFKRAFQTVVEQVVFLIAPILVIAAVFAEEVFVFLFTEKWLPTVPYFRILCLVGIFQPLHIFNSNLLLVKGKSGLALKLQLGKKVFGIMGIFLFLPFGIYALLAFQVLESLIVFIVNSHFGGKEIRYNTIRQLWDLFPVILINIVVATGAYFLKNMIVNWDISLILQLIIGVTLSLTLYLTLCRMARISAFFETLKIIKQLLNKKN